MARSTSRIGRLPLLLLGGVYEIGACSSGAPSPSEVTRPDSVPSAVPSAMNEHVSDVPAFRQMLDAKLTNEPPAPPPPPPRPDLYDPNTVPNFELTLDDAAKAVLSSMSPADLKQWVHGTLKF